MFERDGDPMGVRDIATVAGFDPDKTQRALRALSTEPFFSDGQKKANGDILWVGKPTGAALRVAGQWPTPENLLERLVTALEAAGEDGTRTPEERGKLQQIALGRRTAAAQIAICALGSARGNLLSG